MAVRVCATYPGWRYVLRKTFYTPRHLVIDGYKLYVKGYTPLKVNDIHFAKRGGGDDDDDDEAVFKSI